MNVRRVVFILETSQEKDHSAMESVKSVFTGKNGDFITAVDEKSIIVVKELELGDGWRWSGSPLLSWRLWEEMRKEKLISLTARRQGTEGSFPLLQGGQNGSGCGQDLLQ